jgi:cell division initiation protein
MTRLQNSMQQITPIEIRQKNFERSFRGYSPDEVNAFLHALAYVWEKQTARLNEVESVLEDSRKEVSRLQGVENALLKTIKDAEFTAHSIIEQAKKEAELQARETKIDTEKMIHEAQERVKTIEEDNRRRYWYLKKQMELELERTKKVVQETETYRDTFLQKLQHLAEDILTSRSQLKSNIQRHADHDENPKEEQPDMDLSPDSDSEAVAVV